MENGQICVDYSRKGQLYVTLQNFPTPDQTTEGMNPEALYEDPETGELQGEPPVNKDHQSEGETLLRRADNDEICGFIINQFNYGDSANLIKYKETDGYISYNDPEI